MKVTWPLWWKLKPEAQALLMQYQWSKYGLRLDIPPFRAEQTGYEAGTLSGSLEELEEIGCLMRQAPSRSRGKSG